MRRIFITVFALMVIFFVSNEKTFASEVSSSIDSEDTSLVLVDSEEVSPLNLPNENYPGTNADILPGDILYSTKSLFVHTAVVGHVGIIGNDKKVYHVSPAGSIAGKADTLKTYRERHGSKERIYIYRPTTGGSKAASWASNNIKSMETYSIVNAGKLSSLNPNYCSKFIWQAFYYGAGIELTNMVLDGNSSIIVTPSHVKNSKYVYSVDSFMGLD